MPARRFNCGSEGNNDFLVEGTVAGLVGGKDFGIADGGMAVVIDGLGVIGNPAGGGISLLSVGVGIGAVAGSLAIVGGTIETGAGVGSSFLIVGAGIAGAGIGAATGSCVAVGRGETFNGASEMGLMVGGVIAGGFGAVGAMGATGLGGKIFGGGGGGIVGALMPAAVREAPSFLALSKS